MSGVVPCLRNFLCLVQTGLFSLLGRILGHLFRKTSSHNAPDTSFGVDRALQVPPFFPGVCNEIVPSSTLFNVYNSDGTMRQHVQSFLLEDARTRPRQRGQPLIVLSPLFKILPTTYPAPLLKVLKFPTPYC